VSVRRVEDYEPERVLAGVREALAPLGGMRAFVRPGQRVLLKPNLLMGARPERAITTHPAVVRAAILLAQEAGGIVSVGDSPGVGTPALAARTAGIARVLEETGAAGADFSTPRDFDVPAHRVAGRLTLVRAVAEADVVITLPKLKTHGQMVFTGALKNQYGCIPGMRKSQWHFRLQRREWLAELILDLHRTVRPALAIMDAVVGMEGNGPSAGRPRRVGAILAGADLVAVDTLACMLVNLDPATVPVLAAARAQGLGGTATEVAGDDWRALRVPDFQPVSKLEDLLRIVPLPRTMLRWVRERCTARPRINASRCEACGACEEGCPVRPPAIRPAALPEQPVDDERCIRCYCCQEFCPHGAIDLVQPAVLRACASVAQRAGDLAARFRPGR
jgi:uncharacterized protein (DUF362 family)/Pyruvate/2-oxoacid:ferredoxin oxidoreductase delta subunit